MRQELGAILVAVALALSIGVGFGFATVVAPSLVESEPTGQTPKSQDATREQTIGHEPLAGEKSAHGVREIDQNECYRTETIAECAARVIQREVATFSRWLTLSAFLQVLVGGATVALLFKQKSIMAGQLDISARQTELSFPKLFLERRQDTFGRIFAGWDIYTKQELRLQELPRINYVLWNYGQSPAVIESVEGKMDIGAVPPIEDTTYAIIDLPSRVIAPGGSIGELTATMVPLGPVEITNADYGMLIHGEKFWWFFGAIKFKDIWEETHVMHFCSRYHQAVRLWEPYPPERNYTERKGRPRE